MSVAIADAENFVLSKSGSAPKAWILIQNQLSSSMLKEMLGIFELK
jgi:hypothetical protein